MDNFYENTNSWMNIQDMENLEFPLACEDFFKLIYVVSGVLQISTAEESFELFEGDARLFFAGELHSALTYEKNECKMLTFSTDICRDFADMVAGKKQISAIFKLESDIDYLESIGEDEDYFINKSHLYAILSSFTKKVQLRTSTAGDSVFISEISAFVKEHCSEDITLQQLSNHLGYGYNYTSSLFKKNFKCNFMFFVNQYRIALAETMLKSPQFSITDIAFECGFNSLRSFGRNFTLHKGISPREYRRGLAELK